MKTRVWTTSSSDIELIITDWHTDNQPVSGDCTSSVKEALDFYDGINDSLEHQLVGYPDEVIVSEAIAQGSNNYGVDGQPSVRQAKEFIVWVAISDIICELASK